MEVSWFRSELRRGPPARRNSHGLDHGGSRRRGGGAPLLHLQRIEYDILFQRHIDIRHSGGLNGLNLRKPCQPQLHHQIVQTGAIHPVCPLDDLVLGDPVES